MRPTVFRCAAAWALLLALTAPVAAQSGFPWWKSDQFKKDLGLTADQSTRIDGIYQSALPRLRQGKEELDRQEAELSRLLVANAEESHVVKQIDGVEATRASLNKMRTLMLFHMRQVLTPDQNTRFKALQDKWMQDHPRRPGDHDAPPKR